MGFISLGSIIYYITMVLRFLRFRFIWWTLHPIGSALTGSTWTIGWWWFSIFLSCLAKGFCSIETGSVLITVQPLSSWGYCWVTIWLAEAGLSFV